MYRPSQIIIKIICYIPGSFLRCTLFFITTVLCHKIFLAVGTKSQHTRIKSKALQNLDLCQKHVKYESDKFVM